MILATKSEVGCCLSCGRDTKGGQAFCSECVLGGRRARMRGRSALPIRPTLLEDDYSEESDANSVCEDEEESE